VDRDREERDASRDESEIAVSADEMFERVYTELRGLAAAKLSRERSGHTLSATGLVHEAYLRIGGGDRRWVNRRHFFGAAAEAMRRILVDHARKRNAGKRGGGHLKRTQFHESGLADENAGVPSDEVLAVHEALDRLAERAPEAADVVKLRYFAGLTMPEIGEVLGCSLSTVERHWTYARTWLFAHIEGD
jgi:RNA polymerase sigma factor (TIGR02999 family)